MRPSGYKHTQFIFKPKYLPLHQRQASNRINPVIPLTINPIASKNCTSVVTCTARKRDRMRFFFICNNACIVFIPAGTLLSLILCCCCSAVAKIQPGKNIKTEPTHGQGHKQLLTTGHLSDSPLIISSGCGRGSLPAVCGSSGCSSFVPSSSVSD